MDWSSRRRRRRRRRPPPRPACLLRRRLALPLLLREAEAGASRLPQGQVRLEGGRGGREDTHHDHMDRRTGTK